MKRLTPLLSLALAATSHAQMNLGSRIYDAYREGVRLGKIPADTPRSTEAQGFPPNTEATPLPPPQDNPKGFQILHFGPSAMVGSHVRASKDEEGQVHFKSRGYEVWCDFVDGDRNTEVYDLEGHVRVEGKGQAIRGEKVRIRLKEKMVEYTHGEGRISAGSLSPKLRTDLFIKGGSLGGTSLHETGEDVDITTCDLPDPHFHLLSRSVDIRPNKWMTLKKTSLFILDRKILTLPYLIIPLQERSDHYLPTVGQSQDEGYYILTKWPVPLRKDAYLDQRVDEFSKLGTGLGGDLHYDSPSAQGLARVYQIFGRAKSQLLSLNDSRTIGSGLFRLSSIYQHDNYLTAPNTTTFNLLSTYVLTGRNSSTRLGYTEYKSSTNGFDSLTSNTTLNDTRTFTKNFKTTLDLNMADNSSSSGSTDIRQRRLDVRFNADLTSEKVDSEFSYLRGVPIGTQKNFFSTTDRTPMLTLRTDAMRWFDQDASKQFPWRLEASIGQLADYQKSPLTRTYFDWNVANTATAINGSAFSYDGRLKQGIYSDGTAEYVLAENIGYKYALGPNSYFQIRHSLMEPHGYTPLAIDQSGRSNSSFADLMVLTASGFRIGAQTSYDFLAHDTQREPWQTLNMRLDYDRGKDFYIRNTGTFDTNRARWGTIRSDMGFKTKTGFIIIGSLYDSLRNTFGNLNMYAEGLKWGRLGTSILLNYNGYTKQFDSQQLSLIWDMHCSEAYLTVINTPTGFRNGLQLSFGVRIKGLPFDTGFGAGRRGGAIGTGTGAGF